MKNNKPIIKALIFDFDGLILDTETPGYNSWKYIFKNLGYDLKFEDWAPKIGNPLHDTENKILLILKKTPIEIEQIKIQRNNIYKNLLKKQSLRPGILKLLKNAENLKLKIGIASSSDKNWITKHLINYNILDKFLIIISKDDVSQIKPAPEIYLKALKALKVTNPNEALAFEDSPIGILAAKSAGIKCLAFPNNLTKNLDLQAADRIQENLESISLNTLLLDLGFSVK